MVADFRNQIPNKLIRRCSNTKYQINKSKSKLEVPKSRSKIEIPNFLLVHTKILVKISRLGRKVVVYEKIPAFPNTKYQINESGWQMSDTKCQIPNTKLMNRRWGPKIPNTKFWSQDSNWRKQYIIRLMIGVVIIASIAQTMVLNMQKIKEEFFVQKLITTTYIILMTIIGVIIYDNLRSTIFYFDQLIWYIYISIYQSNGLQAQHTLFWRKIMSVARITP